MIWEAVRVEVGGVSVGVKVSLPGELWVFFLEVDLEEESVSDRESVRSFHLASGPCAF